MRTGGFFIAVAVAFVVLVGLGTWQLQRRAEKQAYIAHYEMGLNGPGASFPPAASWNNTDFVSLEHSKAIIEGHFHQAPEIHLYAVLPQLPGRRGGVGWWIIVPFDLKDGGTVFVNRGFVPQELTSTAQRPQSLASAAEQNLEGLIRLPEKAGMFTPANDLKKNEWFLRDPKAFAAFDELGADVLIAPVVIDQLTPNPKGLPQSSDGVINIPNNHLQYALTWYALAAVLLVMAALFYFTRLRQDGSPE